VTENTGFGTLDWFLPVRLDLLSWFEGRSNVVNKSHIFWYESSLASAHDARGFP